MAFSGLIPTFEVSSNSLVNNLVDGIVGNALGGIVNVALNSESGQQLAQTFGEIAPSPQNLVSAIVTPGLVSTGSEAITQILTDSLVKSQALGPAGNLVADLAGQALGNLSQDLLGSLLPALNNVPTKYFPGAGDEEDANYGGSVYTPGPVGPDIVFTIKSAQNSASAEVQNQISGGGAGVASVFGLSGNILSGAFSGGFFSNAVPPEILSGAVGSLTEGGTANFTNGALLPPSWFPSDVGSSYGAVPGLINAEGFIIPYEWPSSEDKSLISVASELKLEMGTQSFFNTAALGLQSYTNLTDLSSIPFSLPPGNYQTPPEEGGWRFTTAPSDISWESTATVDRVKIFGTNQAPVISGSRGMRELSMSNALIEGFSMNKSVEKKIAKLESLLNFSLTSSYVKVPVYWVTAADKRYGFENGDGGYFVIKQIKVKEELRDLSGNTTRAKVDISFSQVPPYQVDDGRDLASQTVAGTEGSLGQVARQVAADQKKIEERARQLVAQGQTANAPSTTRSPTPRSPQILSNGLTLPPGATAAGPEVFALSGTTKVPQRIWINNVLYIFNGSQYVPYKR